MANKKLQALQRGLKQQAKERRIRPLPIRQKEGHRNFRTCLHPGAFALKHCYERDEEGNLLCSYSERCDFEDKGQYGEYKLAGVAK